MGQKFSDNARALIVSPISAEATSLSVEAARAERFPVATTADWLAPADWFKLVLVAPDGAREVVRVGTRAPGSSVLGNLLRGQDGTTPLALPANTVAMVALTAADLESMAASPAGLTSFAAPMALTPAWADAGVEGADLDTGSYMVEARLALGDQRYSGMMSWYAGETTEAYASEVPLHAGRAMGMNGVRLRTLTSVEAAPAPATSKVLAGYYTAWDEALNIKSLTADWTHVYLFNARPDGTSGAFYWPWPNYPTQADVQAVRARGQKVILTIGGAGFAYAFTDRTKSTNFVNSIIPIITSFGGVDGLDFNNFEQDQSNSPTEMIWIAQQLKNQYGSGFLITAPPGATNTGGTPVNGIAMNNGFDLQLMGAMADAGVLDWAAPQYYDWDFYNQVNTIREVNRQWVARLGANRVVVGLTANYANGPSLADCQREWNACLAEFPTQRGAMAWNANLNHTDNAWTTTMKPLVLTGGSGGGEVGTGLMKLQIATVSGNTPETDVTLTFRRMI